MYTPWQSLKNWRVVVEVISASAIVDTMTVFALVGFLNPGIL